MIKIQNRYFDLKIEYKHIKNIYLKLKGNTLIVTCPFYFTKVEILKFIASKEDWIIKKIEEKENKRELSRLVINERISYLGKWYTLTILKGNPKMQILEDEIIIYCKDGSIDAALTIFYNEASQRIQKIIETFEDKYLSILKMYHYKLKPDLRYKMLRGSWGICYSRKNSITLSKRLIHFDEKCIEAVYWHEILHFILPNHSKRFHEVLEYHMPDYKKRHATIY